MIFSYRRALGELSESSRRAGVRCSEDLGGLGRAMGRGEGLKMVENG